MQVLSKQTGAEDVFYAFFSLLDSPVQQKKPHPFDYDMVIFAFLKFMRKFALCVCYEAKNHARGLPWILFLSSGFKDWGIV